MHASKIWIVVAVAVAAGFFGGRAWTGEDEQPSGGMDPSLMQPGEEHKAMADVVGTWDLVSEMTAPGGQTMSTKGTATFEMILGGRYLVQKVKADPMMPGGGPFEGLGIEGYDRVAKQHFSTWFDNMGTGHMDSTGQRSEDGKVLHDDGRGRLRRGTDEVPRGHDEDGPRLVALILDPKTVDRILSHRRERGLESAFEGPPARAPPAA